MAKHKKPNQPQLKVNAPRVATQAQQHQLMERDNRMQIQLDTAIVSLNDSELSKIKKLQVLRKSKVLVFIAGDQTQMNDDVALHVFNLLQELGKNDRIDMVLSSRGGRTEVPAKLVPLIRNYCEHFGVIVPYRAHSAATHIALGANEIVMGPMSELGPVDPSRSHPLLPKDKDGNPIPISVQDLKHVVDLLKREGPETYTPEALATIFSTMFEYIHPLAMGAIEQSYALAKLISRKLLTTHMDPEKDQGTIDRIVNELSDGFKSHSYQIGWREAKSLGLPILYDDGEIYMEAWQLYQLFSEKLDAVPQITPGSKIVSKPILVVATERSKSVVFEINEVFQDGALTKFRPLGAQWISSNDIPKTGNESAEPKRI